MKNHTSLAVCMAIAGMVLLNACASFNGSEFAQRKYLDGVYTTHFPSSPHAQPNGHTPAPATLPMVASLQKTDMAPLARESRHTTPAPSVDSLGHGLDGCEQLLMKNGEVEVIKVMEVNTTTIKYKRCKEGKARGVAFLVNKHDIYYILHSDGTKETFNKDDNAGENNAEGFGCDELMLKDGDVESVKVLEVNQDDVKYKRCNDGRVSGIAFSAKKKDIAYVRYASGYKETFGNAATPSYYEGTNVEVKESKKLKPLAAIALIGFLVGLVLLWIFIT